MQVIPSALSSLRIHRWPSAAVLALLLLALIAPLAPAATVSAANDVNPIVSQGDETPVTQVPVDPTQMLTLAQLGYGNQTIQASRSTIPIELPLRPGQALLTNSSFLIRYNVSSAVDLATSSITVSVNGDTRTTAQLATPIDGVAAIAVPLTPTDRLPDTASVRLSLQVVLNQAGIACPPAVNPQRWLTIRSDSSAMLGLTNADQSAGLSDLPGLFSPVTPDPINRPGAPVAMSVTIVIGQGAAAEEFQAAGYVAVALGRWAAERHVEPVILFSDQIPADQPSIVVAAGLRFSGSLAWGDVTWDGANYIAPTGMVAPNRGLLALQRTAIPRLLISSATPAGVLDAASALINPERSAALTGSYTILTGRAAAVPEMRTPTWDNDSASFEQLGGGSYHLIGTGPQSVALTFDRPAGWVVENGARLSLQVAVTGNVSPDAALTLTLNGVVIGSMPVAPGGNGLLVTGAIDTSQTVRTADFLLPPELLNVPLVGESHRQLRLGIAANLGAGATCTGGAAPSVTILASSRWVLPHDTAATLDLARFPTPLAGDPQADIEPLMVVLPDWPTTGEQQAALRVIAAVARWSAGDQRLQPVLIPVGRLNPADRDTANLVVVGTTIRNPVAAELVQARSLTFGPPSTTSSTSNYPQVTGDIALLPSPWKSNGTVLVITSDFDAGVPLAGSTFADSNELDLISGGVVTVGGSTGPQVLANGQRVSTQHSGLVERFGWDRWWTFLGIVLAVGLLIVLTPILSRQAGPAAHHIRRDRSIGPPSSHA